jgi:hypothetical protein
MSSKSSDSQSSASLEAVADGIVAYLQTHPLAADSAEGVARWWVGGVGVRVGVRARVGVDVVEAALALLIERGLVRQVRLVDGTALYSRHVSTRQ